MFQCNRKEWVELTSLLRTVGDGQIQFSDAKGQVSSANHIALDSISRLEEQGVRHYRRADNEVLITCGGAPDLRFSVELWCEAAQHATQLLRESQDELLVEVDDAMEAFLDEAQFISIGGTGEGQHHLVFHLADHSSGLAIVLSRCGSTTTRLLDGGRSANMKLEQTGHRFATPMVAKVNALETDNSIRDRMQLIQQMGSSLRYINAADRVFRANLALIDLHLGRLLTEMIRFSYFENVNRIDELIAAMREINPLKVSTELIEKHRYYEGKISQLLLACLSGMRPAKIYHGESSLPPFVLILAPDGTPLLLRTADREQLASFLLHTTRLERGSMVKDRYGSLERENGVYYFKLNLKIALTKR